MGWAKRQMMEEQEQGFNFIMDKFVCSNCVGDYALKAFIEENAENNYCDYCETESNTNTSINLNRLLKVIVDGIRTEWADPNDAGVGWDGREGGWQGAKVIDTHELICYELYDEHEIENDELLEDIYTSISDQEWCEINPYSMRQHEENFFTWELFCRQTMHETRYVFFQVEHNPNQYGIFYKQPYEILETIGESLEKLDLIKRDNSIYKFYRGRTHNDSKGFTKVEQLAPPPREDAIFSNRMSPAGIPMFYGANDEKTAIEEIRDDKMYVTVGQFQNLKDLNLIDLTTIPSLPSIFDSKRRTLRNAVMFIRQFVSNLSKPITKNGVEHIEYVPTQIVTEYFRRIFRMENGTLIDGILYPSSKDQTNGVCCVLFLENEDCTQDGNHPERIMNLNSKSIIAKLL